MGVESIVESLVLQYETHCHKRRGLNEKNAMDEIDISVNEPSEFRAKKLLVVEIDKYWKQNRDNSISHNKQIVT